MKRKGSLKRRLIIGGAVVSVLAAMSAWGFTMKPVRYSLTDEKLTGSIRIVFVSDLHSCQYGGKDQSVLMDAIDAEDPDIVLFGGDVVDNWGDLEDACTIMKKVSEKYPCAYTPGNHELMRSDLSSVYEMVTKKAGVPLLLGRDSLDTELNGQAVSIYGVIDAWEYGVKGTQLDNVREKLDRGRYNILLAHQPEQIDDYLADGGDFDLVLSGHAHGGQWRIPGILEQGLFAPDQGLFPKRTSGAFTEGDTVQIVSRGLARPKRMVFIPRIFNHPELTVIEIGPAGQE